MVFQHNLDTVTTGVQALELLHKIVQDKDGRQLLEKTDVGNIIRQLSSALVSAERNNLNTSHHVTHSLTTHNNINGTEYFSTDGNLSSDDSPMSTDSESCDTDSEPDIDYEEELISRMKYYGQYENLNEATANKRTHLSTETRDSTPTASSTRTEDCSKSILRNNRRRKNRSEPLASSTMIEDLLADVQSDSSCESDRSFVVWSIENTDDASLKEYYNRYFGINDSDSSDTTGSEPNTEFWMHTNADLSTIFNSDDSFTCDSEMTSSDFLNDNGYLPRTSTCTDLKTYRATEKKKTSKGKLPVSKLRFMLKSIRKALSKTSAKQK